MREPEIVLSPREVVIVRGWFDGAQLAEIAGALSISRQRVAQLIRQMRRRGIPLPERANSWRASRKILAGEPQERGGPAYG